MKLNKVPNVTFHTRVRDEKLGGDNPYRWEDVTTDEINGYLKEASENELKDILGFETQPLVSTDYINDTRSSIIDALSTKVVDKRHLKIYAWYDNEYGYSARMADIANMVAESIM